MNCGWSDKYSLILTIILGVWLLDRWSGSGVCRDFSGGILQGFSSLQENRGKVESEYICSGSKALWTLLIRDRKMRSEDISDFWWLLVNLFTLCFSSKNLFRLSSSLQSNIEASRLLFNLLPATYTLIGYRWVVLTVRVDFIPSYGQQKSFRSKCTVKDVVLYSASARFTQAGFSEHCLSRGLFLKATKICKVQKTFRGQCEGAATVRTNSLWHHCILFEMCPTYYSNSQWHICSDKNLSGECSNLAESLSYS